MDPESGVIGLQIGSDPIWQSGLKPFPAFRLAGCIARSRPWVIGGAYSTLTEYLRLIGTAVPRQFERRFETLAGQQAEVDFAEFQVEFTSEPGLMRKVWLFSMVLGHSRWLWGRFCPNQSLDTVMRCHIAAFDAMGGACTEILYDRMETAVVGEDAAGVVTYNTSLVRCWPITGRRRGPASRIGPRRKARSSGRSATFGRTSFSDAASTIWTI